MAAHPARSQPAHPPDPTRPGEGGTPWQTGKPCRLRSGRLLRGANLHHNAQAFLQEIVPGNWAGLRLGDVAADLPRRFGERFDRLAEEQAGGLLPAAVHEELSDGRGPRLVDALLDAVLAIERFSAQGSGRPDLPDRAAVLGPETAPTHLLWSTGSAATARTALRTAFVGLGELLPEGLRPRSRGNGKRATRTFAERVARLQRKARRRRWSPAVAGLVQAARDQQVPHQVLAGEYVRLGHGVRQQVVCPDSLHLPADAGSAQYARFLESLLPDGQGGRIPTVMLLGDRGTRRILAAVEARMADRCQAIGVAVRRRTTIAGRRVDPTSVGRNGGADFLLGDPRVDLVLAADRPHRLLDRGLRLERVGICALLDPPRDDHARAAAEVAALRIAAPATAGVLIVGTGHPAAAQLVAHMPPDQLLLVAHRPEHELVGRHLQQGGPVVRWPEPGSAGDPPADTAEVHQADRVLARIPAPWDRPTGSRPAVGRRALTASAILFALGAHREAQPPAQPLED